MKNITIGLFASRRMAEETINDLHRELNIPTDDISFVYKNDQGVTKEVDADDIAKDTPGEGAKTGAAVGGSIGALAGLAVAAGVIPVIGPIFAAGPLISALGLAGGALGTAAAGAATGVIAGGLIGGLTAWGISETDAKDYNDQVTAGNILVAVHTESDKNVASIMTKNGAENVRQYDITV